MMTFERPIYKDVDYKKIYRIANYFLAFSKSIASFPFKVKEFITEVTDIRLCSFKKAREAYNIDISVFGSESAIIQEYQGMIIIFYNQDEPDHRIRFSILHEFAHYILGHKMNLVKNDPLYHKQELEANCLAAQMLMPEQLLRECVRRQKTLSVDFIMKGFSVSDDAAGKRKKTLANTEYDWHSRSEKEFDDIILSKYAEKLNVIAPKPINLYDFEEEYAMQCERDSWSDSRSRYDRL